MVHKGIDPYVCYFCDKVVTQALIINTHMKIVDKIVHNLRCEHCGKCFGTTEYLRSHW